MKKLPLFPLLPPKVMGYGEEMAKELGYHHVVGVDEAGRGPLAGPVVAAAVFINDQKIPGLNDSKKLSESKREILYNQIVKHYQYGVGFATSVEIDQYNILGATHLAMNRALGQLPESCRKKIDIVLVDGNLKIKKCLYEQIPIIKGDGLSYAIAAASILAKVTRDRYMVDLDQKHPQYGFKKHKGYPTKDHLIALKEYGVLGEHRRSFRPVREALKDGE